MSASLESRFIDAHLGTTSRSLFFHLQQQHAPTANHSLRVGRILVRLGGALSQPRRKRLIVAGLLHDIGKMDEQYSSLIRKPGPLSVSERRILEGHVRDGFNLLTNAGEIEVASIIAGHHDLYPGGYPRNRVRRRTQRRGNDRRNFSPELQADTQLLFIADEVDAMTDPERTYRQKPLHPKQVLHMLSPHVPSDLLKLSLRIHLGYE